MKVLLVDDEPLIRTGLRAILEPELEVVGEAGDGAAVAPLVRRLRPDVVVMDIRMPGVDGIEATRRILAHVDAPPRILILTTFEHDDHVLEALRAGASGFLLKRAEPAELVRAIRLLAEGDSLLFPAAIRRLAARQTRVPRDLDLTAREAEILRAMTRGLSNAEIAEALVVSLETVKTHVSAILSKLGARDRTQAVIRAYESGFVSPSQEGDGIRLLSEVDASADADPARMNTQALRWTGYGAAAWAIAYAIGVRFYQAAGGTIGLSSEFENPEDFQRASFNAGVFLLLVGIGALAFVRPWGLKLPRWLVIVPALTGSAVALAHGLTAYVTKPLHALDVITIDFPGQRDLDEKSMFLWDLLFYEPWFLGLGVLTTLGALYHHDRTGGSRIGTRGLLAYTAVATLAIWTYALVVVIK